MRPDMRLTMRSGCIRVEVGRTLLDHTEFPTPSGTSLNRAVATMYSTSMRGMRKRIQPRTLRKHSPSGSNQERNGAASTKVGARSVNSLMSTKSWQASPENRRRATADAKWNRWARSIRHCVSITEENERITPFIGRLPMNEIFIACFPETRAAERLQAQPNSYAITGLTWWRSWRAELEFTIT